jgi:hypothetical protein
MTEVFVSIDNLEFTKLDLSKDESILMKYTQKDLQDISKIFAPYSQNFNFPATPKNRMAFGFFGDTEIVKIDTGRKYFCKIYTDGILNLSGFIVLSELSYANNKPQDFTGNFTTSMLNLKDRIGDDSIRDLAPDGLIVDWTFKNVFNLVKGIQNKITNTINTSFFVPLISNNRVWGYNQNDTTVLKDNIAYKNTNLATSINLIQSTELRPAISFSSIIDLIIKKYDLNITCPLFSRKEYKDLYVWCNNESIYSTKLTKLTIKSGFGSLMWYDSKNEGGIPDPKKYTVTATPSTNIFKVVKRALPFTNSSEYIENGFNFSVYLAGVSVTGGSATTKTTVTLKRKTTLEVITSKDFDLTGSAFDCVIPVSDNLFIGNEIEFEAHISFNQPLNWSNCAFRINFRYYDGKTGAFSGKEYATYLYESISNNNSADLGGTNIDLFKSLPDIKVVDFLSSFFKAFNISIFDTSPNDENLFWLTPYDIQTSGQSYSKATLDYTPYIDVSSYKKAVPSDYNYYNFKHATSKYKSNVDYASVTTLEYGQIVNPAIKPNNAKEFKIETNFSLIVPVTISGTAGTLTHYGFTNDTPEIIDTGETRYTPNFGELTVFYSHGNQPLPNSFGFKSTNNSGVNINAKLDSHIKVAPWNIENDSFAFSVLVDYNLQSYPINLYLKGYDKQTSRLLDTNVLSHEFTFNLPSNEIYLNEATTIQGGGNTPAGFRLQNDIIVGETLFTILDSNIDITTGKAQLTLLNL